MRGSKIQKLFALPMLLPMSLIVFLVSSLMSAPSAWASLDLDQLTYTVTQESRMTANVRLDGLSIFQHGYGLSLDVPLTHGWTLGPSAFHYPQSYGFYNFTADGVGLVSLKYFNGKPFRSGWYAGPMAYYVQGEGVVAELGKTPAAMQLGIRGGYQWMWDRFNVQAGITSSALFGLGQSLGTVQGDIHLGFVL